MRYSVYKFLKWVSDSVLEAILHLKEHPESVNMLEDCTEAVLAIKSTLEANKEVCIDEIEKFFGKINEIIECIEGNKSYVEKLDELYSLAIVISEYCKSGIKYKLKIVFFAELGSKWDSMDSVYRAYKNRGDCDVSVVLAPIYRAIKLPNGEVKSDVIYRDYLTDMGIDHIPFQKYDIKKDMPDMVFTSQPYESVTPEMFWAENIAPYTRLVYLPYFTVYSLADENERLVEVNMPIHKLAWRVISQSQKHKELCIKYSEDKKDNVIACGLPKWDWVVNMDKREIELPKEWEKLRGKKVVLRNFHYNSAAYAYDEPGKGNKMIYDMRKILCEYEGTNIAYIYRFHPMTETMFKIYFPEYLSEWEKVKKEIEKSSNVVIDYNESYEYAFKFSDIFFTEYTSMIPQYALTKKPIVVFYWGDGTYEKTLELEKTENLLLKYTELHSAQSRAEGEAIRNRIFSGDDFEYDKRMNFINKYIGITDGKIGERLANKLIEDMLIEDKIK